MPGRTFPTARPAGRTRARSRSGASTTAPPTPSRCGRGTGRDHEADVAIAMSERRSDHVTAKQSPRRQHKDGRVAPPDGSVELASVDGRVHLLGRPTDRSGPKCRREWFESDEVVFRYGFLAETISVDQVNRHQAGCGRCQGVAGSSAPVANAPGLRQPGSGDQSHSGAPEHSAVCDGGAHLVFQPSNGDTHTVHC